MKIKATLRRHDSSTTDVLLTYDSTATVADAARALAGEQGPESPTLLTSSAGAAPVQLDPQTPLAEAEIGSGFTIEVVPASDVFESDKAAAAVLRVVSGPDAGMSFALPAGNSMVGRSADCTVNLNDRMVSTRHARIEVGSGIELVDLNSANGILVDGGLVQRLQVIPGQLITLGATDVYFELLDSPDGEAPVYEKGGSISFNRSPRVEVRYPGRELKHPTIPQEASPRLFPWPMIFAPLIMGLTIFSFTQRALSLIVVLVSPLMMLGNLIGQRTQSNNKLRQEIETFERQFEQLEDDLFSGEESEREHRRSEAPATATVFSQAESLGPLLWTRRPEHWNFLSVRLGSGRAPSRNTVTELTDRSGLQDYVQRVEQLRAKYQMIDDVPIIELLPSCGAIGIAGPRLQSADALRGLAVQLFGLHAPNELCTAALIDPAWTGDLEWFKWLPHATGPRSPLAQFALADTQTSGTVLLNALEEIISRRSQDTSDRRGPLPTAETAMELGGQVGENQGKSNLAKDLSLVLFVTNDAPVDRARLSQVIERGPAVGIFTIFVAPTVESLPASCRTFIDVSQGLDDATVAWVRAGEQIHQVQVEGVSAQNAEHFARRLSPIVDSSSLIPDSSDLPESVSLLRILGTDLAESSSAVVERWRQNNSVINRNAAAGSLPRLKRAGTLRAFIGQGSPDAMSLDLRTQGPHALVGGTTGSGKSEFLQAWVLAMAAEYSPDRVTFLFVDYKGGSAFADCVELPHCVGLVTDLSPHLVRRALTSLRAELHHREKLFHRKKAKDLLELEKRQDPQTPPALVLVIDEFAALAGEVPEFVDGVVDIAQRGRSLGIHLIMATQRPAGVIKDNLRANTNLRVALRMADAADSNDVVEDPVAAGFDPSLPGRGIAKTGPGRLIPFQSGYAGGWTTEQPEAAEVRVEDLRFGGTRVWEQPDANLPNVEENNGPNDQKRLVNSFIAASHQAAIPAPRRPWLDDLSATIDLRELAPDSDSLIPLALADIPEHQAQETAYFEPDTEGHLLVYGTSGSGKSAALRSIAIAAGANPAAGTAAVYALEFGTSSLRSLSELPHVGAVIGGDDVERIQRVFRNLAAQLDERSERYAAASTANLSEYRQVTGQVDEPRIFLLIDGFGAFRNDWELGHGRGEFYQVFMRIVGEGRPLGIHVVATADRFGAVPTAISANITQRVVLRMSDEQAYNVLGAPKDVLNERSVPGRAIIKGHEAQIAVLGGTANVAEQTTLTTAWAQELISSGAPQAAGVKSLPLTFDASQLPDQAAGLPVIGLSDTTLGPIGFEPIGTFVVVGPPQSGKTNTLRAMVNALDRQHPGTQFFHLGGRRAELRGWRTWHGTANGPEEARRFAKDMLDLVSDDSMPGKMVFVVENMTEFADSDAERPLKELIKAINRSDHFLIADGDINQFSSSFGLLGELKSSRHGIALKPDAYDGDSIFKVPFPRVKRHEFPVGRGFMVQNGQRTLVHVPLVEG